MTLGFPSRSLFVNIIEVVFQSVFHIKMHQKYIYFMICFSFFTLVHKKTLKNINFKFFFSKIKTKNLKKI
jgi:hypothetical protein